MNAASAGLSLPLAGWGCCFLLVVVALLFWMAWEDLRSMSIPAVGCYALIAAALLFQLCVGGVVQVFAGAAWALIVVAACLVANACQRRTMRKLATAGSLGAPSASHESCLQKPSAIGSGDVLCMVGLCLMSGQIAPLGMLCCFAVVGAFSLVGVAGGRLHMSDAIPLVPFFFAWLIPVAMAIMLG